MSSTYALRRSFIAFTLCFGLLLLSLCGCKHQAAANNGISGTVVVQGGSPAGTLVEVYGPARSSVWVNNDLVPSLGFRYSHTAGFDWRLNNPIASVTVGANGNFELPDLTDREYILIARKDSFGWTAPRSVVLRGQPVNAGTLTLYKETILGRVTSGDETWLADHHYVVNFNYNINQGHTITVQPGAVIRAREGVRIIVHGSLIATGTPTQFITFTSDERDTVTAGYWWNITVETSDIPPVYKYVTFSGCEQGVNSLVPNTTIEDCYFRNVSIKAATFSGINQPSFFVRNMVDRVPTGVTASGVDSTVIEHNVFQTCSNFAVSLESATQGSIFCNGFFDCGQSDSIGNSGTIYLSYITNLDISHNNIYRCFYALNIGSGIHQDVVVHNNMISSNYMVIFIGFTPNRVTASYPKVNDNCILGSSGKYVKMTACGYNNHEVDISGNYWATGNLVLTNLNDKIWDCLDEASCGCVITQPVLTEFPSDVGACNE